MSRKNKDCSLPSKRASVAMAVAAYVSCDPSQQMVTSYLTPLSLSPPSPIRLCLKRLEIAQHMYVIDKFLLNEECHAWIEFAENIGFEDVFQAATSECAHRDNGRIQFDDDVIAGSIFQRLSSLLPSEIDGLSPQGCSSNIRLYRYSQGQRFGRHIDESHNTPKGVSKFTLLVYLNGTENFDGEIFQQQKTKTPSEFRDKKCKHKKKNNSTEDQQLISKEKLGDVVQPRVGGGGEEEELVGGETVFYSSLYGSRPVVSVRPVAGRLLLHGHGQRCLTHEGAEVMSGVKYLLRTDVLYS